MRDLTLCHSNSQAYPAYFLITLGYDLDGSRMAILGTKLLENRWLDLEAESPIFSCSEEPFLRRYVRDMTVFVYDLQQPVEISGNSPAAHPDFSREPSQTGEGYRCSPTYLSTSMYTNRITAMK